MKKENLDQIIEYFFEIKSRMLNRLLSKAKTPFVHLLGPRPKNRLKYEHGRGVSNRNKALEYLRQTYYKSDNEGVVYFADDDNAYDTTIFEEMRYTKKVSMFPVGLMNTIGLSTPIVNRSSGKIVGFHDPWIHGRKFAVDMAGLFNSLNIHFIEHSKVLYFQLPFLKFILIAWI